MKKFFIQIGIYAFILFLSLVLIFYQVDGYDDFNYLRFTSPDQSSMILGVSKSAQGLQPQIFNKVLDRNDMFNYSFNAFISPYGNTYLESIKRKLDSRTTDGIFILTFDAWSLGSKTDDPNDSSNFREINLCLDNYFVSLNPNIPYLLKYYEGKYIDIFRKSNNKIKLHNDGWLEVNVAMDSLSRAERLDKSVKHYNKIYTPYWKFSELRFEYLSKTIEYLNRYGSVFLVRLPVHERLLELENQVIANLDEKIFELAERHDVVYYNFPDSSSEYIYTDGIHLGKNSGEEISKKIANRILDDLQKELKANL